MADLQELFARLNGQGNTGAASNTNTSYQQPSVSSPIYSPSPSGPHPHHQSAIMSPNSSAANTPAPEHGGGSQQTPQQQSAHLLNLLRFNSQPSVAQARRPSQNTQLAAETAPALAPAHGRAVSASDLVASFMGGKSAAQAPSSSPAPQAARLELASVPTQNPQELLMRLLNHPKPAQSDSHSSRASAAAFSPPPVASRLPETAVDDIAQDLADAKLENVPADPTVITTNTGTPMKIFGSDGAGQSSSFEPKAATPSQASKPKFTYVNPFDKLEAASPRNRTPAPESTRAPVSAPKVEILKPKHGLDGSPSLGEMKDQPTQKVRKLSPTATPHESVAEAVTDLAGQVGKQVDEALAEVEGQSEAHGTATEVEQAVVDTAVEIKKELEDEETVKALEETVAKPLVDALKEVATEIAQTDIADSWESAEDSPAKDEDQTVIVYRFPMRAFASITVKDIPQRRTYFQPELFMDVARLKKEFDQIDRNLVSASKNYIAYAIAKKSGFRIIRQENGQYRQVFEDRQERLFNIGLCAGGEDSIQPSVESVLGIGVNGTVFWTSIEPDREDRFGPDLDSQGLVLPPSPSQDDNTSGGQLKTRAKPSSRHPEFFAVGRGKAIHIVWPRVAVEYANPKTRVIHTQKYFKERSLKILTGKAGKDFTFSEDDTVIVSLDKAGRMRFWDIRDLTNPKVADPHEPAQSLEVSQTMLEFHTTSASAKSWPTSVFFFDKDKPFNKGIALRYVMVGMKQNHSFQLWDLGLGKAVQEINLPHEKESDAICSVAFHPKTGIMAVAHPTRNSIFFVHVSCPRYNLPVMNQAVYTGRIANKNDRSAPPLPPVNATAIMTSITEYSFASKGQIRSLHMLNEPAGPPDVDDPDNTALFELYAMHSKGVCTLRIRRSDLGWKKEGEPIHPKEAEEEGVIVITQLKPPQPIADESSTSGDTPGPKSTSEKSARESIKKESSNVSRQSMTPEAAMRASTLAKVESKQDAARAAIINGGEKSEKKKKKRSAADTASQASTSTRAPPPSYAQAAQSTPRSKSPAQPEVPVEATSTRPSDTEVPEWAKSLFSQSQASLAVAAPAFDTKKVELIVQTEINKAFSREFEGLYKRIDEDKRVMNAQNGAKQEAILRMVSSTLNENVEGVIRKMVNENMREVLLPQLMTQTSSSLEKSVGGNLKSALSSQLSKDIPDSVTRALKSPQLVQSLSDHVAKKVTGNLDQMVTAAVGSAINPVFMSLTNLVEQKIGAQLHQAQVQHLSDATKISQLTDTVQTCLQTIQGMAIAQAELQNQVAKLQQHLAQAPHSSSSVRSSPQTTRSPAKQKTPEQLEEEEITRLMKEAKYEQGTMQWLQSPRSNELFDTVFVHCNPGYLERVSPLLALSTGAVVTNTLENNLPARLIWLDTVLKNVDPMDAEIQDVVPKIMEVINQRLTAAYISLNESSPGDQSLRRISNMVTKVSKLSQVASQYRDHA
ncbi:hypothetical protein K458DRAFT_293657 [Lentithecium fluviatile CBS 122367]|uniref:EDC4-like protein pdc1 beta-propeller domain-containing protein n=1 Tax=Lentithecium fluviatile CBS 122367 TaxID=1168545 RepID=A0A6G1JDN8_9PLEO|nr:hypothetical protein K458DRAFT_293657 [Lentithecium fluviatile CBS 122367]